jgi:hypothetical protein
MRRKRQKPEEVVAKLRQVDVAKELTISNRPSVSTAICRLRPTIFLPAS